MASTLMALGSPKPKLVKKELGRLLFYQNSDAWSAHTEELKPALNRCLSRPDPFIRVAAAELLWRWCDDDQGAMEITDALNGPDRELELYALFSIFRLGEKPVDLLVKNYGNVHGVDLALKHYRSANVTNALLQHLKYPETMEQAEEFDSILYLVRMFPTKDAAIRIQAIIQKVDDTTERTDGELHVWQERRYILRDDTSQRAGSLASAISGLSSRWKSDKIRNVMTVAEIVGSRELFPDPELDDLRRRMHDDAQAGLAELRTKSRDPDLLAKIDFAMDIVVNNKVFSGLSHEAQEIGWDRGSIRPLYGKNLETWANRDRSSPWPISAIQQLVADVACKVFLE
jgi:hypothetical protein